MRQNHSRLMTILFQNNVYWLLHQGLGFPNTWLHYKSNQGCFLMLDILSSPMIGRVKQVYSGRGGGGGSL